MELLFELSHWRIELQSGEILQIRADAFALEDGDYNFIVFLAGEPRETFLVATIPEQAVSDVWGGPGPERE